MKLKDNIIKSSKIYKDLYAHMMSNAEKNKSTMSTYQRVQAENKALREKLAEIAGKLAKISVQRNPENLSYRICVELDSHMIQSGMIHGNDHQFIEYLGEEIGHKAARQMREINYERWET